MYLTKLSSSVKRALSYSALISLTVSPQVFAADDAEKLERIEVTGSRINRTDIETASPVMVISSDFIMQNGFQSVEEILSNQPSVAGMNIGSTSNNGSGGSATVNLRGMGEQRTLVLLNGRRMVASGTGADASVDLNTIPVAMIKSIEILKDGASAVYGSDAIAGVVNIITKKDFEGTELTVDASQTDKGDGTSAGFSLLHGMDLGDGNLVVGVQYSDRGEVIQSDRDFVPPGESSFIPDGTIGGKVPDGNGGWKDRDTSYDYTTSSYAQTPNEIASLFSSYTTELDGDTELNIDLMYTHRSSNQQMAPQPASIMLDTEKLFENIDGMSPPDVGIPGLDLDEVEYKRRMTDAGPRIYEQTTNTYRLSAGIQGALDNDINWDISATYGRNDSKDKVQNSIHAGNMEQAIYDDPSLWIGENQNITRDYLVDTGVIYTEENEGGNEQFLLSAGFSGITEFDLGWAVGVENRFESGYYTPDEITQRGQSTAAQQDPTEGDYTVQSIYSEFSLPLLDDALTLDAALRYDNYSTFGGATTWKLGATYRFNDQFMVRGVAATGFRAPNVSELYGGNTGSYDYLEDPWGREEDSQILVNYTSDADLQPEESESLTFGAVWEISEGLSTTLDYWKFDITNAISRVDVQHELNKCYNGDAVACDTINITPDGDLSELTSPLTNLGYQKTSGIDWNINWRYDIFKVSLDTTYLIEFEQDDVDYTGRIDGNMGGYSELKSNLSLQAQLTEQINLIYRAQYIQGMDGNAWGDEYSTGDVVYHHVSAAYQINDDLVVTGGVKNIFDTDPEEVPDGNDMNTVPEIYDVVGRTFFLSTTFRF